LWHLTTRLQGTHRNKLFKWSNSASLGHSSYRQRLLLNRCLAAWNWKNFIPSSGLQGWHITLSSDQFTCMPAFATPVSNPDLQNYETRL
jgi:hypothetical protein